MTTFLSKNDAYKGEMESFPMIIDAQCKTFKIFRTYKNLKKEYVQCVN